MRMSLPRPRSRSMKNLTAFALVKINPVIRFDLLDGAVQLGPARRRYHIDGGKFYGCSAAVDELSANTLAWSRERVTTTRFPNSGLDSYQFSFSLSLTTSPTMMMAGGPSLASLTLGTMSLSVPVTTRWSVRVPHWMRAIGVSGLLP